MKTIFVASLFLAAQVAADLDSFGEMLMSDEFTERQGAEKKLIEWSREKDPKKRADAIFQRYLVSEDPEESHRLIEILLNVHFEQKKAMIPQRGPGFIGIRMSGVGVQRLEQGRLQQLNERRDGVVIEAVIGGTPAEKAGLKAGDVVKEINGESIAGDSPRAKLQEIVGGRAPGTSLRLSVERGEETIEVEVTLMNAEAVPAVRSIQEEPRVDTEKAAQLLKEDYLRWLADQKELNHAVSE